MAIDREETKNLLFGGFGKSGTSKVQENQTPDTKAQTPADNNKSSKVPKWKTLEKVTILLTSEQKDAMDEVARKLMRFRQKKGLPCDEKERITANSVVRAILDNAIERVDAIDIQSIRTEDELKSWIATVFK